MSKAKPGTPTVAAEKGAWEKTKLPMPKSAIFRFERLFFTGHSTPHAAERPRPKCCQRRLRGKQLRPPATATGARRRRKPCRARLRGWPRPCPARGVAGALPSRPPSANLEGAPRPLAARRRRGRLVPSVAPTTTCTPRSREARSRPPRRLRSQRKTLPAPQPCDKPRRWHARAGYEHASCGRFFSHAPFSAATVGVRATRFATGHQRVWPC